MILEAMMPDGCLLDTSFFIRLLNEKDRLFKNTDNFYKYFLQNKFPLYISTISIAEYCTKGSIDELPLKNLLVVPFNYNHAICGGKFANILYEKRKTGVLIIENRPIIINDAKLLAQSEVEPKIKYFVTADKRSKKFYDLIKSEQSLGFEYICVETPCNEIFGILDL